jgi:hypothetical protein
MESNPALERLTELGVTGILVQLARNRQLVRVRCEMPLCYREDREQFDSRSCDSDWSPTADHYPRLKMHGGHLTPENVRLAHKLCNRRDYSWRVRNNAMLLQGRSLKQIADELNRRQVATIPRVNKWTAAAVRKAFVS